MGPARPTAPASDADVWVPGGILRLLTGRRRDFLRDLRRRIGADRVGSHDVAPLASEVFRQGPKRQRRWLARWAWQVPSLTTGSYGPSLTRCLMGLYCWNGSDLVAGA